MTHPLRVSILALTLLAITSLAIGAPDRAERPKRPDIARLESVRAVSPGLIQRAALLNDETAQDVLRDAELQLARIVRYANPEKEEEAFIIAAHALRTVRFLGDLPDGQRESVGAQLARHEELSRELVFTRWEQHDTATNVGEVLTDLMKWHSEEEIVAAPRLAAAICVVHDRPQPFRANENTAMPEKPGRLFAYFTSARMNRLTRGLSPELLAWVVDAPSAGELLWANNKYAGRSNVGALFHNIQYDDAHFQMGADKRVTVEGFSLPNIEKYGGVCIDQAYFASMTGRAIGVPSAVCTGQGSSVGHAWVGYLRVRGNRAWWDFTEGRYEEYTKVRGTVLDPQRRVRIPDGEVAARAASYGLDAETRHLSTSLVEASRLLERYADGWTEDVAPWGEKDEEARDASLATRFDLLQRAATLNPGELRAWEDVGAIAATGAMDTQTKGRWADAAMRLAGKDFVEFAVDFAMPLIDSVEDQNERSLVLGRLFDRCEQVNRPGVAAEIMIANARLYEEQGDPERAYEAYAFVAERYADVSALAVDALSSATTMLHAHGHHGLAADLAKRAFSRTTQPNFSPEFAGQSNWTRIGRIYVSTLRQADRTSEADSVQRQLSQLMDQ